MKQLNFASLKWSENPGTISPIDLQLLQPAINYMQEDVYGHAIEIDRLSLSSNTLLDLCWSMCCNPELQTPILVDLPYLCLL